MKQKNLLTVLLLAVLFFIPTVISAADVADQGTTCPPPVMIGANFMVGRSPEAYQTFTPALNRLSKVRIPVSVEGVASQNITLKIYQGSTLVVSKTLTASPSVDVSTPLTFDFTDVAVTPGTVYKLMLSTSVSTAGADWMAQGDNCYAGGTSYGWGTLNNYDYNFTTYGWNYTAPAKPTTPAPSTGTATTTPTAETPTTDTPAATTPATEEPAAATSDAEIADDSSTEKLTLVESVTAKPIYWMIPLVILLLAGIGFLVLYELKLKPKKEK